MKSLNHKQIVLESLIQEDLYTYCQRAVGQEEADVLLGILGPEVKKWFNGGKAKSRIDKRSKIDFAQALVLDKIVLHWLKDYFREKKKWNLVLNGCDKDHTLIVDKVTTYPDFKVEGKDIYIEEITSYTSFVRETGAIHLRGSKGKTLKRLAEDYKVYLLVVDIPSRSYAFVEITKDTPMYYIEEIVQFGGKCGYGMDIGHVKFKSLNIPV